MNSVTEEYIVFESDVTHDRLNSSLIEFSNYLDFLFSSVSYTFSYELTRYYSFYSDCCSSLRGYLEKKEILYKFNRSV